MGNKLVEFLAGISASGKEVAEDVYVLDFTVVTACLLGMEKWILVDTGLENSAKYILHTVAKRFGKEDAPEGIILTHGHFDHVGSIKKLVEIWNVPVYAHKSEFPYLTGKTDYPLGDPTVDSGLIAKMSPTYPHTSIDLSDVLIELPEDGSIPGMEDWKWIHTTGHTDGHISLFREKDRILIAGDALTTTKQESLLSVLFKKEHISGPPKYLTSDFRKAEESIKLIKELNPEMVIPSHGKVMTGDKLHEHLNYLVNNFTHIAVPKNTEIDKRPRA